MKGGIENIALIAADDLVSAEYDHNTDAYTKISVREGAGFVPYRFAEDQAYYIEQIARNVGQPVVRHELHFTVGGMNRSTRRAIEELANAPGGVVALVEGRQGETMLLGWSAKFAAEQPLRLSRAEGSTRSAPDETPAETIALAASDTEKASTFTGEIPWKK